MIQELFDYGIHNEASNIRAHVAPLSCCVFVFPRVSALKAIQKHKPKTVKAWQPGFDFPTAEGYLINPSQIPYIRTIKIDPTRFEGFSEELTTTEKGDKAVYIVEQMLKAGKFPLWLEGEFVNDQSIQVTGTDVTVSGRWKIEVKCDYRASHTKGEPNPRCTGNLFLQIAEVNPGKYH